MKKNFKKIFADLCQKNIKAAVVWEDRAAGSPETTFEVLKAWTGAPSLPAGRLCAMSPRMRVNCKRQQNPDGDRMHKNRAQQKEPLNYHYAAKAQRRSMLIVIFDNFTTPERRAHLPFQCFQLPYSCHSTGGASVPAPSWSNKERKALHASKFLK